MVEEKDEETLPPEVKKDLLKEGWTPPEGAPKVLGAGEGQAPNEASEVPQQASDKQIEQEDKEYTEKETKQDFTEIPTNKTSETPTKVPNFVCAVCGKPFDTKRALTGHMSVHSRKKKKEEEKEETKKLEEKEKPLVPYAEMGEPEDFLRGFLEGYEFKDKFIDLLCRRVVLREELPHPNDLAADLLSMEGSGVKSARNASAIAEDYAYAHRKYLGEMREQNRPHTMGYDTRPSESPRYPGGIPYDSNRYTYKDHERPQGRGIPVREPQHDREDEEHRPDRHDMDQPVTMKEFIMWQKEEDLRRREEELRLREDGGGIHRRDEAPDWMQDRVEKLEEKIRQRDEERMERLEKQLETARSNPGGVSRDEVASIFQQLTEAQREQLGPDDVRRIIRDQTAEFRVGLTKDDLEYLKAKDHYRLEEHKLDEKGKTREELANIARGGFKQVGEIVARTLTEAGATTGTPTRGIADQTGTVLQVNCPGCGAAITSPITENRITCSSCGRQYTVERPPPANETLPPPAPPKKEAPVPAKEPPAPTDAGFSVEPPISTEPTPPIETPEKPEEFTSEEKEKIDKSIEDAKEGRITPLNFDLVEEPEPTVDKIAENLAIGEGVKKLEEELKKEKTMPPITGKECPICKKKCKSKTGVKLHAKELHPEYK